MVFAQERKDYREAMGKVMAYYNNNDAAGLNSLFSGRASNRGYYTRDKISDLRYNLREMTSYKYIRQREDGLIIFKVTFVKYRGKYPELHRGHIGWVGMRLDKNNKLLRLSLPTTSYSSDQPHYLLD